MADSRTFRAPSLTRTDAVRDARMRLADVLAAKERIETRIIGLRKEAAVWRDRAQLARRHEDAALLAAARARVDDADAKLSASMRDREALDVHIVRLRHAVHAAQGGVRAMPAPPEVPSLGRPSSWAPADVAAEPGWSTLERNDLDREIEAIRRRLAARSATARPDDVHGGGHAHR